MREGQFSKLGIAVKSRRVYTCFNNVENGTTTFIMEAKCLDRFHREKWIYGGV